MPSRSEALKLSAFLLAVAVAAVVGLAVIAAQFVGAYRAATGPPAAQDRASATISGERP